MGRAALFVVRIWRDRDRRAGAAFRANVRAVDDERGRVFTRPADVARFLADHCPRREKTMRAEGYTLDHLVSELREARLLATSADDLMRRARVIAVHAAEAKRTWLLDDMRRPDPQQGFGFHLLHEEADHTLAMFVASWLPGRGTPPHNHGTWAVVVGLEGVETNTRWRRTDDCTRPGYVELAVAEEKSVGAGDVLAMRNGVIHSVRNDGTDVSVSLHIYGRHVNFTERSQFDREAHRALPYRVATSGSSRSPALSAEAQ